MHGYQKICEELKKNKVISANDIFDFEYSPLKDIYRNYFEYCQENLINYCQNYDIQPARFYFHNEYAVNARAATKNGYFVIGVNMGTIQVPYRLFYEQNDMFAENEILCEHFKELSTKINVSLGFLMFHLSTLFTYHHELAHLVQKSSLLKMGLTEQYAFLNNHMFNIVKHVLEFDSDLHGADAICSKLLEHFKKLSPENQTGRNLVKLLSLGISSIFSYFLLCFNINQKIYYREFSHPHPLIRISYVLDRFIRVASENLPINVNINPEKLVELGFVISDIFFKSQKNTNQVLGEFQKQFLEKFDSIENYINELSEHSHGMKNLMMNRA